MPELVQLPGDDRQAWRIDYHFSPTATAFILDSTFITGYFGPFGCSKTAALSWKTWLYCQAFDGAKVGLMRDTWPNLRDTTMAEFFKWFPPGIAGHYHKTDKIFELRRQAGGTAFVYFRHLDSEKDISNTLSLNFDALGFDEPQGGINSTGGLDPGISVNLYRALTGRIGRDLTRPPGLVFIGGNPPAPDHWIAAEFGYSGHGAPTNPYPDRHLYLGTRADNIRNLKADYYERLERVWGRNTPMTRRFLYGDWISFGVEKPFQRAWIRYWGKDGELGLPPDTYLGDDGRSHASLVVHAGFDPAISKKDTAARSALVVAGQVRHPANRGRILMLESLAGHWTVWEQVDHILKAVVRWKVRVLHVEKVAYQAALKDVLDREARTRGITVTVELVAPEGDKMRRAAGWSPLVEDGTILFAPQGETADLEECMVAVPGDPSKWDPVDAAGMCVKGLPVLTGLAERISDEGLPSSALAESYGGHGMPQTVPPRLREGHPLRPPVRDLRERAKSYAGKVPGMREGKRRPR